MLQPEADDHDDTFFGPCVSELNSAHMGVHSDYEYHEDKMEG